MPKQTKKSYFYITPLSVACLKAGLCIVILQLAALWITVSESAATDPYFTTAYYSPAMPYVALTLCVVISLSLAVDIVQKAL